MAAPKKQSAGLLLWRRAGGGGLEVLLVHPSGSYNRKAAWSLPKGELDPGEEPEAAARRETLEETGVSAGELVPLGFVDYTKSRKRVFAFGGPAPEGCLPRCASWEIDRAEWLAVDEALRVVHHDQRAFVERLIALLASAAG